MPAYTEYPAYSPELHSELKGVPYDASNYRQWINPTRKPVVFRIYLGPKKPNFLRVSVAPHGGTVDLPVELDPGHLRTANGALPVELGFAPGLRRV